MGHIICCVRFQISLTLIKWPTLVAATNSLFDSVCEYGQTKAASDDEFYDSSVSVTISQKLMPRVIRELGYKKLGTYCQVPRCRLWQQRSPETRARKDNGPDTYYILFRVWNEPSDGLSNLWAFVSLEFWSKSPPIFKNWEYIVIQCNLGIVFRAMIDVFVFTAWF